MACCVGNLCFLLPAADSLGELSDFGKGPDHPSARIDRRKCRKPEVLSREVFPKEADIPRQHLDRRPVVSAGMMGQTYVQVRRHLHREISKGGPNCYGTMAGFDSALVVTDHPMVLGDVRVGATNPRLVA